MAILDIFKKKPKEKPVKKSEKPQEIREEKPKRETKTNEAHKVLKAPQITEKATEQAKQNKYTFKIAKNANKLAVKKAVEDLYGVDVLNVKIIKTPKRRRRLGRILGWRKGYKKAIVKIKEGQKIEVMPR